jgi:tetratricopeptide (TPR) repeat protein
LETLRAEAEAAAEPRMPEEETGVDATADVGLDLAGGADEFVPLFFSPSGADVYADVANAYAFILAQREQSAELEAILAARPTLAGQYQKAISAARAMLDQPPESLAGSADTAVQHYLRRVEELLRAGEYYQARALCERAEVLDRHNPLVLMSHGHAMLAAGEYYSAAHKLSRAVELFPGIAFFKLDLRAFITEPDVLEKRRADLERRLEEREDYRFRFVLGYAEYYSGLEKYGLENLKKAAELAPEHSGIARLHHMLSMQLPEMPN